MSDDKIVFPLGSDFSGESAELSMRLVAPTGELLAGSISVVEDSDGLGIFRATMAGDAGAYGAVLLYKGEPISHTPTFLWNGTTLIYTELGTNAPANWINAAAIATDAITASKIADDAITVAKIQDEALTAAKFASGAFDAVWERLTSALTTVGSVGRLIADRLPKLDVSGTLANTDNAATFRATGFATTADLPPNFGALAITEAGLVTTTNPGGGLTQAQVREAVGLASANLDTQLGDIASKTTNLPAVPASQGDVQAVGTAVGDLNDLDAAQVQAATASAIAAAQLPESTRQLVQSDLNALSVEATVDEAAIASEVASSLVSSGLDVSVDEAAIAVAVANAILAGGVGLSEGAIGAIVDAVGEAVSDSDRWGEIIELMKADEAIGPVTYQKLHRLTKEVLLKKVASKDGDIFRLEEDS